MIVSGIGFGSPFDPPTTTTCEAYLNMEVLVEDVLDTIIQCCPIYTISIISRVSYSLRRLALPHLLHSVCLDRSPMQVVGFLNFILDNGPESFMDPGKHVFELEFVESPAFKRRVLHDGVYLLTTNEIYRLSSWAPMLTQALMLMPNLRSFTVKGNTDDIVTHSPSFGHILGSLSSLTSLTLWGVGSQTSLSFCDLTGNVETTGSSLRELKIAGSYEYSEELTTVSEDDGIGKLLAKHSHTLKELCLVALNLMGFLANHNINHDRSSGCSGVAFPLVTKLTIGNCSTTVESLACAFPMLQTLCLDYAEFIHVYSSGVPRDPVAFPNLASIQGWYKDVYEVLRCNRYPESMRRVVISYPWSSRDEVDTFPFAVPSMALQLQSFHFMINEEKPISWWKGLSEHLSSLTYLSIVIHSSSYDDWRLICYEIPAAISSIPIRYLSIVIEEYEATMTDPAYAEESLALSFSKEIPALQYMDVLRHNLSAMGGPNVSQTTWWTIVRGDNSNVSVEQLDWEEGNRLRDYYDWTFKLGQ
ncbi:hypothetical protein JR316_0012119 [Psilocybe cubensis]|uniref:F-box domain-containing protein n=2 Tax=Psilocybe cubensis TaxID=181762 RepID=A0A8H7XR46_PSICU|nr:hypothetical protein JR316_0012119 [Psilocybe cubensis]KAH9475018.1 hypothetical protein JR316_0012119 [Psilocybe cubensis]